MRSSFGGNKQERTIVALEVYVASIRNKKCGHMLDNDAEN